jgi:hypothetical protein
MMVEMEREEHFQRLVDLGGRSEMEWIKGKGLLRMRNH